MQKRQRFYCKLAVDQSDVVARHNILYPKQRKPRQTLRQTRKLRVKKCQQNQQVERIGCFHNVAIGQDKQIQLQQCREMQECRWERRILQTNWNRWATFLWSNHPRCMCSCIPVVCPKNQTDIPLSISSYVASEHCCWIRCNTKLWTMLWCQSLLLWQRQELQKSKTKNKNS